MPKAKSFEEQISQANPFDQVRLLSENMNDIQSNLGDIIQILLPFTQNIKPEEAPCEFAKFVADKVCKLKMDNLKKLSESSLNKLSGLVEKTSANINNLNNSLAQQNYSGVGGYLAKIVSKTAQITSIMNERNNINNQSGGNLNYRYITHPYTGEKLDIHTKEGKNIILSYLKNI